MVGSGTGVALCVTSVRLITAMHALVPSWVGANTDRSQDGVLGRRYDAN